MITYSKTDAIHTELMKRIQDQDEISALLGMLKELEDGPISWKGRGVSAPSVLAIIFTRMFDINNEYESLAALCTHVQQIVRKGNERGMTPTDVAQKAFEVKLLVSSGKMKLTGNPVAVISSFVGKQKQQKGNSQLFQSEYQGD